MVLHSLHGMHASIHPSGFPSIPFVCRQRSGDWIGRRPGRHFIRERIINCNWKARSKTKFKFNFECSIWRKTIPGRFLFKIWLPSQILQLPSPRIVKFLPKFGKNDRPGFGWCASDPGRRDYSSCFRCQSSLVLPTDTAPIAVKNAFKCLVPRPPLQGINGIGRFYIYCTAALL